MQQEIHLSFESSNGAFSIKNVKGKLVFVKNYLLKHKKIHKVLEKFVEIERRTLSILNISQPDELIKKGFKKQKENLKEIIEKEVKTNRLWIENGILTPQILNYDSTSLTSEFIPSKTFHELINGKYQPVLLKDMFAAYQAIREKALSKNDPYLLHLDPHSKNFLRTEVGDIYAIDSSFLLKKGVDTKTADSIVNGLFLLQLENLNSDSEIFAANVEYCKKLFGADIKKTELPRLKECASFYYKTREKIVHKIKRRSYSFDESPFKNYNILRKILS